MEAMLKLAHTLTVNSNNGRIVPKFFQQNRRDKVLESLR